MSIFEKHNDPNPPVVLAAERRIEELHQQKRDIERTLGALEPESLTKPTPALTEILETLPDPRPGSGELQRRGV